MLVAPSVKPGDQAQLRARSPSPFKPLRARRRSNPNMSSSLWAGLRPITTSEPLEKSDDPYTPHDDSDSESRDADAAKELLGHGHGRARNDEESQRLDALDNTKVKASTAAEYQVATRTKLTYLAGWFALNLGLTIYNKAVLGGFHFPWLLTTIHTSCVCVGCYLLLMLGYFKLTELNAHENLILVAFSFLFTINIAISNVSLAAVSVPFHQIMRSTCPVFTILIYRIYYSRSYAPSTYLSIIPIIGGVAIATYGDYYFTITGFLLTLLGVVLASLKTVVSNRLMTGSLALPALEILLRMTPLATIQSIGYAIVTGEARAFLTFVADGHLPLPMALALLGNGILAFGLNVSSFQTNKLAGALTLTVAGNLKQCLTILLGIVLFNVRVTLSNGIGMFIAVFGAALYSKVELDSKGRK